MSSLIKGIKVGSKYNDVIMKLKMAKCKYSEFELSTDTGDVKAIDVIVSDTPITLVFDKNNNFSDWR